MLDVINIVMRDITRLDPKLLVAFDAVMEERSVTRAAVRLNMTQQGLSGVLQRLRDLFGDPLFVRDARGVRGDVSRRYPVTSARDWPANASPRDPESRENLTTGAQ